MATPESVMQQGGQQEGFLPVERALTQHAGADAYNEPWFIEPTSGQLIEDMESWRPGKRARRRGAVSCGAVSSVTNAYVTCGLGQFYDDTLRQDLILSLVDSNVYALDGAGTIIHLGSGATFARTPHQFVDGKWRGLSSTYLTVAGWDATTTSLATNLFVVDLNREWSQSASVAFHVAAWWQSRIWGAGNVYSQFDDTLWWSELLDGLSYCAINTMNIEPGRGGGRITGLVPVRADSPNLVIFKPRLIALLTAYWGSSSSLIPSAADALDTVKSSVTVITDRYGCVAANSIQSVEGAEAGDYIFLAHDGFRTLKRAADDSLAGATLPVSTRVQDWIGRINFSAAQKIVSDVWDLKYWCALPLDGSTENNAIIMYDLVQGGWHLFTWTVAGLVGLKAGATTADKLWMLYNRPTSETVVGSLDTGFHVFKAFDGYVDPGSRPTPWREHGRALTFGTMDQKKRWGWFAVELLNNGATAAMDILYRIDNTDWFHLKTIQAAPIGGWDTILAKDALPWKKRPPRARVIRVALDDIEPAYMIQFAIGQTGASDYSRVQVLQTMAAADIYEPEFDNGIA